MDNSFAYQPQSCTTETLINTCHQIFTGTVTAIRSCPHFMSGFGRDNHWMQYKYCGRSGLKLPLISLGLWHNFGSVDDFTMATDMIK